MQKLAINPPKKEHLKVLQNRLQWQNAEEWWKMKTMDILSEGPILLPKS